MKICVSCNARFDEFGFSKTLDDPEYDENEICMNCYTKQLGKFWISKDNYRVSVESDGYQFIAQIQAGMGGETYLSVGYSCPNGAEMKSEYIEPIKQSLDYTWKLTEEKDLEEMMPSLLNLCKIANNTFNKLLFDEYNK